jgi:predicted NAD/FAD-binding protein
MASAVWSMSMDDIERFPAVPLIRFFDNHGMLGINTHPQWKVIRGGSDTYIPPLTLPYRDRIVTGVKSLSVARSDHGVTLRYEGSRPLEFDDIVFACPARDALTALESPTAAERTILTSSNEAVLHTDSTILPSRPWARASWNYRLGTDSPQRPTLTYHMNRLQNLDTAEDYCVSLNDGGLVDRNQVLQRMTYRHPLYDSAAVRSQARWNQISGCNRTHYCGAYWLNGFHEDGLNSAIRVAKTLGVDW